MIFFNSKRNSLPRVSNPLQYQKTTKLTTLYPRPDPTLTKQRHPPSQSRTTEIWNDSNTRFTQKRVKRWFLSSSLIFLYNSTHSGLILAEACRPSQPGVQIALFQWWSLLLLSARLVPLATPKEVTHLLFYLVYFSCRCFHLFVIYLTRGKFYCHAFGG